MTTELDKATEEYAKTIGDPYQFEIEHDAFRAGFMKAIEIAEKKSWDESGKGDCLLELRHLKDFAGVK